MIRAVVISTLVLGLAGLASTLASRASASVRHAIWLIAILTTLGVAITAALGPVIEVESTVVNGPGVVPFTPEFLESLPRALPVTPADDSPGEFAAAPPSPFRPDPVISIWLIGVLVVIGRAILGHVGIRGLVRRSRPLAVHGLSPHVEVRLSADVDGPYTLGARRAVILLPAEARDWGAERLRIVLVHELAHVARLDYAAQLIATAACAVYWFNPITWLAASRLRAEAEHAADDRVLAAGVDGITYASHLLELARPESGRLSAAVAVGMARGTTRLERRFTAMLDSRRSRGIVPLRFQAAASSAALLAAVPLTVLRLVPAAPEVPAAAAVETAPVSAPGPTSAPAMTPASRPANPSTPRAASLSAGQSAVVTRELADSIIERTLAASPGERISIDLRPGGSVTIRAWDQPQVRMRAVLSGNQVRETRVEFERTSGGLRLHAYLDSQGGNSRNSNRFELWVPRRFDADIASAGGGISISGVEGRFTGNTGGGEIALDDLAGEVRLSTGGGEVHVTNSSLDGSVSTGGGEAVISNTTGNVRVSSGSGPVIRTDGSTRTYGVGGVQVNARDGKPLWVVDGKVVSDGSVSFTKAGGAIRLDEAPNGGTFTTGGGDIDVGAVGGAASFMTGGGDVRIVNVKDDISVTTGAGSVELTLIDGNNRARNVTVHAGVGRIVIELPANLDVRFDLETAYTERNGRTTISSDFPVNVTETQEWDSGQGTPRRYVRGTGSIGSGRGLIKIRTVNGDVIIRRR